MNPDLYEHTRPYPRHSKIQYTKENLKSVVDPDPKLHTLHNSFINPLYQLHTLPRPSAVAALSSSSPCEA
jgi:hypothetical protein